MELLDQPPAGQPIVPPAVVAAAAADASSAGRPAEGTADAPAGRPADVPAVVDWNQEARDFINFAHELYTPLWPSLEKVYTADVRERIAARAAPVMRKYDFNLARLFGKYGDEIMLGAVLVPLVPPTLAAIRHDRAAMAAAAKGQGTTSQPAGEAPAHVGTTGKMHVAPGGGSPLARFNDANAET